MVRISEHTRAAIIEALKRNPNSYAVSKQFEDVSPETVRNIARRLGIPPQRAIKFTEEDRANIAAQLRKTPYCPAVARAHGDISIQTVRTIAAEYGIPLPRYGRLKKQAAETDGKTDLPRSARDCPA